MIEKINELIYDCNDDATLEYISTLNNDQVLEILKSFYYEIDDLNIKVSTLEEDISDLEYKIEDSVNISDVLYLKGEVEDKIRFDKFSRDDMEDILRAIDWIL